MLIQDLKCGIRELLLQQSDFTMRKKWYLQIFLFPIQVNPNLLTL